MAWKFNVLVVANVTADAPEVIGALKDRASKDACAFMLLVPAPAAGSVGRDAAKKRLESALAVMRDAELEVEGRVGDHDPIAAVHDAWDPTRYDEVVISTRPTGASKWLQVDLPHRVEKLTGGTQVTHVVAEPPRPEPPTTPAPKAEKHGVLAPLMAAFTGRR